MNWTCPNKSSPFTWIQKKKWKKSSQKDTHKSDELIYTMKIESFHSFSSWKRCCRSRLSTGYTMFLLKINLDTQTNLMKMFDKKMIFFYYSFWMRQIMCSCWHSITMNFFSQQNLTILNNGVSVYFLLLFNKVTSIQFERRQPT